LPIGNACDCQSVAGSRYQSDLGERSGTVIGAAAVRKAGDSGGGGRSRCDEIGQQGRQGDDAAELEDASSGHVGFENHEVS
jgi:hypothetical protein